MAYYIDLFSPETYEAFSNSSRNVSGFRLRQEGIAQHIKPGDMFVCYLTRLSRWFGVLEVVDGPFKDDSPIFYTENDPFKIRFHVKVVVWLDLDKSIPIHDLLVWNNLSFTKDLTKGSIGWTGKVRSSLSKLDVKDGRFLVETLKGQTTGSNLYPIDEHDAKKLASHTVVRPDKVVSVSVPDDFMEKDETVVPQNGEIRESIKMQALLAKIGATMGMSIWIPRSDRGGVIKECKNENNLLIERLPLNYDDTTLRTIEQIDVLWLRGRSIVRAFEVEHTTSVYSGILRMADLLALQPNMDIKLHIVAPVAKREKVFQELRRPVFSLLEKGPLAESCTYLSYDSLIELAAQKHLTHLSDSVLDKYAEEAD